MEYTDEVEQLARKEYGCNCDACCNLIVQFNPHLKTHKPTEVEALRALLAECERVAEGQNFALKSLHTMVKGESPQLLENDINAEIAENAIFDYQAYKSSHEVKK